MSIRTERLISSFIRSSIAWMILLVVVTLVGVDMVTCAEANVGICIWSDTSRGVRDAARETGGAMIAGALVGLALVGVQEAIEARRESRAEDRFAQQLLVADAELFAAGHSIESVVCNQIYDSVAEFVLWTERHIAGEGESRLTRALSAGVAEHAMLTRLRTMLPLLTELQEKSGNLEIAEVRYFAEKMLVKGLSTNDRLALARKELRRSVVGQERAGT